MHSSNINNLNPIAREGGSNLVAYGKTDCYLDTPCRIILMQANLMQPARWVVDWAGRQRVFATRRDAQRFAVSVKEVLGDMGLAKAEEFFHRQ